VEYGVNWRVGSIENKQIQRQLALASDNGQRELIT
jgi:hypothetical protein